MKLIDRERIQKSLRDSIVSLCQSSVNYDGELIVEGLLGITLDKKEIILVKINKVIKEDGPKDLSIRKRSVEKRKSDIDDLNNNDTPSLVLHYPSKKPKPSAQDVSAHNYVNRGNETSQRENQLGSALVSSSGTLRMPIIPPEYVQSPFHRQDRSNEINTMAEKHSEISRILGGMSMPILNIVPQPDEDDRGINLSKIKKEHQGASTYMPAYDGVDDSSNLVIVGNSRPKPGISDLHAAQMNNSKAQGYFSYMKSTMASTNTWVSLATKTPTSSTYSQSSTPMGSTENHTIGAVVDTNVQPPASLGMVSESGMMHSIDQNGEKVMQGAGSSSNPSPTGGQSFTQTLPKENSLSPADEGNPNGKTPTSGSRGSKEFRRFRCTMCPASSSRKFNLQRHMKSHHPGYNDCYIIDLTPKERGHSKAGDMSYTPKLISSRSEESNDSSTQAIDLSTAGMETWYGDTTENVLPNATTWDSNIPASSLGVSAMSPVNKESTSTGNSIESVSKKVTDRVGKSNKDGNGGKVRKGLDQVLFSKFGFYTNMKDESNEKDAPEKSVNDQSAVGNASIFPGLVPLLPMMDQDLDDNLDEERGSVPIPLMINQDLNENLDMDQSEPASGSLPDTALPCAIKTNTGSDLKEGDNPEIQSDEIEEDVNQELAGEFQRNTNEDTSVIGYSFSQKVKGDDDKKLEDDENQTGVEKVNPLDVNRDDGRRPESCQPQTEAFDTEIRATAVIQSKTSTENCSPFKTEHKDSQDQICSDSKADHDDNNDVDMNISECLKASENNLSAEYLTDSQVKANGFIDIEDEPESVESVPGSKQPAEFDWPKPSKDDIDADKATKDDAGAEISDQPNTDPHHELDSRSLRCEEVPDENNFLVDGSTKLEETCVTKDDDTSDGPDLTFMLDEDDKSDSEQDIMDENQMSINDENANEDTLCKLKIMHSVRKKSTDVVGIKKRISPRDTMKLRTRTLSGSGKAS